MSRRLVSAVLAAASLAVPAGVGGAQTRTVVVPADAAVVVPPRGSALPRPALNPVAQRPRLPPMAPPSREASGMMDLRGAGSVAGVLLPAVAAAAVAALLSNGAGGSGGHNTSGPVRTR